MENEPNSETQEENFHSCPQKQDTAAVHSIEDSGPISLEENTNNQKTKENALLAGPANKEKPFQCEVCNKTIPSDRLDEHNTSKKHTANITQMQIKKKIDYSVSSQGVFIYGVAESTTDQAVFDYLSKFGQVSAFERSPDCILVQFTNKFHAGKMVHAKQHLLQGQKLKVLPRKINNSSNKKSNKQPKSTSRELKKLLNGELDKTLGLTIEKQAEVMLVALEMSQGEVEQREKVINKMESWLSISFPSCRLLPFGSSISGLSVVNSDLDLYFDFLTDDKVEADWVVWRDQCIGVLYQASLVIRAHPEVSDMFLVRNARIPVIKFVHAPTGLSCDITCHNKLGVKNSQLLRSLIAVDPVLFKPFFSFLKVWVKCHRLIGGVDGTLSSYAMNLLAFFYLQQLKLLPSVEELQKDVAVDLCRYWNASFSFPKPLDAAIERPTLLELFTGFFQFYQSLDSAQNVICPFNGQLVPAAGDALSDLMPRYAENLLVRQFPALKLSQFNVQDPFEQNHNVTFGFNQARHFQLLCRESERICRQMTPLSSISGLLSDSITSAAVASAPSLSPKASVHFKLTAAAGVTTTKEQSRQAINAIANFLVKLLNYSYGLTINSSNKTNDDAAAVGESPEAKKPKNDDTGDVRWNKYYDVTFPFDVFHPLREEVTGEVYRSSNKDDDDSKSLLDRERQITSILSTKRLDGSAAAAFSTPGVVVIKLQMCNIRGGLVLNLENKRKSLQPTAFLQLVDGLGRHVRLALERFITQNQLPFSVHVT